MKIEIKISTDEQGVLTPLIKELEINSAGNDITTLEGQIKELNQIISDHCSIIKAKDDFIGILEGRVIDLKKKLDCAGVNLNPDIPICIQNEKFQKPVYVKDGVFEPIQDLNETRPDTSEGPKTAAELGLTEKPAAIVSTNEPVRACKECGNPVPPRKKTPFCSTRCYNTNYVREHSSKKVKKIPTASG